MRVFLINLKFSILPATSPFMVHLELTKKNIVASEDIGNLTLTLPRNGNLALASVIK